MARVCLTAAGRASGAGKSQYFPWSDLGLLALAILLHSRRRQVRSIVPRLFSTSRRALGRGCLALLANKSQPVARDADALQRKSDARLGSVDDPEHLQPVCHQPVAGGVVDCWAVVHHRRVFPCSNALHAAAGRRRSETIWQLTSGRSAAIGELTSLGLGGVFRGSSE